MTKKLLLLILIVSSHLLMAQDIDRTRISGKIAAQQGDDVEGITIYNQSSQKGTLSDAEGDFLIEVAENDRIFVTSLQYQSFTVLVDKGIVDKKRMKIFLNPAVNQLAEVVVRPYDLSGNVKVDVKRIPTYTISDDWDLSYENLEYGYEFAPDDKTAISGNAAEAALNDHTLKNGANILAILGGVANLLYPKENSLKPEEKRESEQVVSNNLRQRFSRGFVEANFDIPEEKAVDFLYFAQENGLDQNMLKPENEMELMRFLTEKSKEYKHRSE